MWARGAARKADIRRIQIPYLSDWLADALDRVGQTEAAGHARQQARWHWECHHHPVMDNPDKPSVDERARRGDLAGALERAERAEQELPGNPFWLSGYGHSLSNVLAQMGRFVAAIAPARKAVEIEPENPFLHEQLGLVLIGSGGSKRANRMILRAIEIDPEIGRLHRTLGESLLPQDRSAEAVAAFREAVRLDPDDPQLVRRLGAVLMSLGDYPAAEAAFRQALALRSEAGPHIDLYECYNRQQRPAAALAEARAAVALEPTNPHWHHRVALSLLHAGRLDEAEAAARTAVANGSGMSAFQDLLLKSCNARGAPRR